MKYLTLAAAALGILSSSAAEVEVIGPQRATFSVDGTQVVEAGQLSQITFSGLPNTPFAGFDPSNPGRVTRVPEPSAVTISIIGGFCLALGLVIRRRRD